MNNNTLDIFIGLSLVFLLYSLLATTIQEIIARWLGLRARMLTKALRRMLCDDHPWGLFKRITFFAFFRVTLLGIVRFFYPYFLDRQSFLKAFYDAPSIKYLAENSWNGKPSYLEPATFSQTVVTLLRGPNTNASSNQMELIRNTLYNTPTKSTVSGFIIGDETLTSLRNYYTDAGGDVERFKTGLESWFTETMNRATGWYKKQCQVILLGLGLLLASYNNINAINIYHILSENPQVRLQMVNMAIQNRDQLQKLVSQQDSNKVNQYVKQGLQSPVPDSVIIKNYSVLQSKIDSANLVMGIGHNEKSPWNFTIGCLLTAIAISLGANFWFDLLSKFMSLRASGKKPAAKSGDKKATIKTVG